MSDSLGQGIYTGHLVVTGLDNNCARRYAMCSGEILRHASASEGHTITQVHRGLSEEPLSRLGFYNVLDGEPAWRRNRLRV